MTSRRGDLVRRYGPLAAAVPWATWAVLRRTGTERGWPLVPAFAFTPYAAVTSLLPLGLAVRARDRAATAVAATSTAALAGAVLQRAGTLPPVPGAGGGPRVRLTSINLLVGRADPAEVVALVRAQDVDVLALQEVTPQAEQALRAAGIEVLLPHAHVVHARPGSPVGAGGALFTRLPVVDRGVVPGRFEQPFLRLAVDGAADVEVTAVHSEPPRSPREVATWTEDLRLLPHPAPDVLRVLAGDYNATLDHAGLRRVLDRGYVDAAHAVGRALATTWTPLSLPLPRLVLDHVLVDRRIAVRSVQVLPVTGSDHRSLVTVLELPPR
ncbi:endonuclease/exonuclease/phosphatase family protein [Modestobacter sp. I12A-02628]|uniref:Endonuclease/exonuclease/phosphatase family protein n=1 Tax=Goekera deserti TaxID=2497753 RepID=A0A7K3WIH2_9ACTN|nr:endonuclease/exonuclease/phosphatase family protein [Goekera deserti]MPQ96643.1 endonuclease/exonuclease/phosphatase family protein [Goekera deserti]NDI47045.1 endonuclease/exonuclease/phosphatase family protein [Goekera deserti]NEL56281.1 endonuclease/exonuclease/phosphatase family protein [Goekera deserti]